MDGGIGNDTYVVDSLDDVVVESELENQGIDTVRSSVNFSAETSPYLENITLTGTAAINATGNGLNNTLIGNTAANQLLGNGGNDILNGGVGADTMDGGAGNDAYYVDNAGDRVVELSTGGTDWVYATVSHTLANYVENLYASGSSSINLVGNTLANTIYGNSGGNKINGGDGKDVLKGGAGRDTFYLTSKLSSNNVDKILDFSVADDSFRLDNAVFKKLGSGTDSSPKKLSSSFFTIGTKAQDSNDYLIYNNKTGYLYYDADGSGSGKAVLIATLSKNLKMTYSDFYVM
jgi:serralysin